MVFVQIWNHTLLLQYPIIVLLWQEPAVLYIHVDVLLTVLHNDNETVFSAM